MKQILAVSLLLAVCSGQNAPNTNNVNNINSINNNGQGNNNNNNVNNNMNNLNNNNQNFPNNNNQNLPNNNNQNSHNNNNPMINNQNQAPINNNVGNQPFLPEYPAGSNRIYRPCPRLDLNCIRKYFEKFSKCKITYGAVPDPLYAKQMKLFFPNFNLTVDQYDVEIRGLNGDIGEFYVNELTDLVVLQVLYRNVRENTTLDVFRYHRPGKVDAITKSNNRAEYPSLATTTVFRGVKHLDLKTAETTAFIDTIPAIYINPSAGVHPDPGVQRAFAEFVASPFIVAQEIFLTQASYFAANYIQYSICDFGLKLID